MSDKRSIAVMAVFAGILGACVIIGNWWFTGAVLLAAIVLIWRFPELHRGTSTGLVINKVPSTSRTFSVRTFLPFITVYALIYLTVTFAPSMNGWAYLLIPLWMLAGGFYGWAEATNFAGKPIALPSDSPAMLIHLGKLGAYDGTLVKIWRLAQLLDQPEDTVIEEATTLQRDGLVYISTVGFSDNPAQWSVQLQPKAYEHVAQGVA